MSVLIIFTFNDKINFYTKIDFINIYKFSINKKICFQVLKTP